VELYTRVSRDSSKLLTKQYSTSFSSATRLFSKSVQPHIYAIYGLVRIADEVVDTYRGKDVDVVIADLEAEVYTALKRGYSTNPIIHSFVITANAYGITKKLIHPFFVSMTMDLSPQTYTQKKYETYIYGSAEVVGLMCLKVFCEGDETKYVALEKGASALGAAYQKVNFLRDMAADYVELNRVYFPGVSFESFSEKDKASIVKDIEKDFKTAHKAIDRLPQSSQAAVSMSVVYYEALLKKLKRTPAAVLIKKRVRINNIVKTALLTKATIARKLG